MSDSDSDSDFEDLADLDEDTRGILTQWFKPEPVEWKDPLEEYYEHPTALEFKKTASDHAKAGCDIAGQLSRTYSALRNGEPLADGFTTRVEQMTQLITDTTNPWVTLKSEELKFKAKATIELVACQQKKVMDALCADLKACTWKEQGKMAKLLAEIAALKVKQTRDLYRVQTNAWAENRKEFEDVNKRRQSVMDDYIQTLRESD